ncbi:MAG TPA: hypothetical protein VMZ91_06525 [Candidatus Paceibacterota bacterium]|nr:hypothetical protein [Candidatus Paceibacterota bacterium]
MEGKKKNKDEVYISEDGILTINNQEYLGSITRKKMIDGIEHDGKTIFKKFDRKDFDKKVSLIVDKIKNTVTKEELIEELIIKQGTSEIDRLYDVLKSAKGKKKQKITKQDGCIGIKIGSGKPKTGGRYLQLID